MKIAIIVIITLIVASLIAIPIGVKFGRSTAASHEPTAVRVEPVAHGDLAEIVSAPGQIEPKTKVQISAKVVARINRMPFEEGETVTKGNPQTQPAVPGSVLVELDSTELEAQLRAVKAHYDAQTAQLVVLKSRIAAQEAQIAAAKVMLADAERDLKRQKQLLASKDVSQSTVDAAQAKVDQQSAQFDAGLKELDAAKSGVVAAEHELIAAEAEIARATDNLSYTKITSPIDGVITRINAKAGEMVVTGTMNNPGTVIMEVADLSHMLVNAHIDESMVAQVKKGQKSHVRISAYPDDQFDGVVESVSLDVAQQGGQTMAMQTQQGTIFYKTEVALQSGGKRIFSGLSADVDIETELHKNVLKIPSQAVLGRATDTLPADIRERAEVDKSKTLTPVVYRFVDGKAVVTPVKIGASDVTHTVITSGVKEGEKVIVGPYKVLESLQHDQKVKDERATTQATTKP